MSSTHTGISTLDRVGKIWRNILGQCRQEGYHVSREVTPFFKRITWGIRHTAPPLLILHPLLPPPPAQLGCVCFVSVIRDAECTGLTNMRQ